MEQSDPNIDLLEGLKALRKVSLDFARAAEHPFEGLDIELSRLRATVENLGTRRPARPLNLSRRLPTTVECLLLEEASAA